MPENPDYNSFRVRKYNSASHKLMDSFDDESIDYLIGNANDLGGLTELG